MHFADQALATLPRILGRRRVRHVRRGQATCAADATAESVHQVREWTDGTVERGLFAAPEDRDEAQQPAAPHTPTLRPRG